ncbi:MAG: hypothetical protein SGPRY_004203 [Prymnesium sp.]
MQVVTTRPTNHTLHEGEMSELARVGRENFERQTARLREEARAMRMGAQVGNGSRLLTYFVSTLPARQFLSEEAMGTTLLEAGLVPHGTLMVRHQLSEPAPAGSGAGEQEVGEEGRGQEVLLHEHGFRGEDEEEDECKGVDKVSGSSSAEAAQEESGGERVIRRRAEETEQQTEAVEGRSAGAAAAEQSENEDEGLIDDDDDEGEEEGEDSGLGGLLGGLMMDNASGGRPARERHAQPLTGQGHVLGAPTAAVESMTPQQRPRRQAALAAAITRSVSLTPTTPPPHPNVTEAEATTTAPSSTAPAVTAVEEAASTPRAQSDQAARAAAAAFGRLVPSSAAGSCSEPSRAKKPKESIAERMARVHGSKVSLPPPSTSPAHSQPSAQAESSAAGVGVERCEQNAKVAALKQAKAAQERERLAIKARLEEDRRAYQALKAGSAGHRLVAGPSSWQPFQPEDPSSSQVNWEELADATGASESELRVRTTTGAVLRLQLDANETLATVASLVAQGRSEEEGSFVLRVPFPRREYATPEELQTSLRAAQLVPRGTLLVLNENDRGRVRLAAPRRRHADGWQQMMSAEMQSSDEIGDGAMDAESFEDLLQLGETLGEASVGLSRAELHQLQVRQLDDEPTDEQFVKGDRVLSLKCSHDFHPECIGTWLRSKRTCPLCKQDVM